MKSFRMEKFDGDKDVTTEGLVWLLVLALVFIPLVVWFAAPLLTGLLDSSV